MDASVICKMELMCPGQSLPCTISFLTNDFSSRQLGSSRKSGRFPWRFEDLFHKAHLTFPKPTHMTSTTVYFSWICILLVGMTWMEPWYNVVTQDFFVLQEILWKPWLPAQAYFLWRWYSEIGGKLVTQALFYLLVLRVYTYDKIWNIMWIIDCNHYRSTGVSNESVQSLDWSRISYVTLGQNFTIY